MVNKCVLLFVCMCIHSFIYSFVNGSNYVPMRSLVYAFVNDCTTVQVRSFVQSFTHKRARKIPWFLELSLLVARCRFMSLKTV